MTNFEFWKDSCECTHAWPSWLKLIQDIAHQEEPRWNSRIAEKLSWGENKRTLNAVIYVSCVFSAPKLQDLYVMFIYSLFVWRSHVFKRSSCPRPIPFFASTTMLWQSTLQIIVILPMISKNYLLNLWSTSGDQVYAKDDVVATSSEGVCDEFQVVTLVKIQELGRRETIVNINMNQSL